GHVLWCRTEHGGRVDGSTAHEGAVQGRTSVLDEATLDAFVRTHHARLTGLARLVCRDTSDAADAVQSAFEQAWRYRSSLRDPSSMRSWLDRIVVPEAIRQDRRRRSPPRRLFSRAVEVP